MRVTGTVTTQAANAGSGPRAAHAAFALPTAPPSAPSVASTPPAAGLLALQDLPLSPDERRRKTMRRASTMLDRLAELQGDLLAGKVSSRTLGQLRAGLVKDRDADPDRVLAGLLCAVETRCAVELAKLERDECSG
jgi:hypothetical protein